MTPTLVAAAATALALLTGCTPAAAMTLPQPVASHQIPDYDRDRFGQAWSDDVSVPYGRNGCDTRNDVLQLQLVDVQIRPGTGGCVVAAGILNDPYTADVIHFHRGDGQVQIDHVVPLAYAWRAGAWAWTDEQRRDFANDTGNLEATQSAVNQAKSDSGPSEWLPPSADLFDVCAYASNWTTVVLAYGLQQHPADAAAAADVAARCRA